ncbi:DUF4189 domain-containing protein [Nocardia halotolerans]|uniref:DUF4189 domain-containing protein n=1 Tax=Nocardia halotolerans TaxID=1755878 RepID=A0ABV8VG48_9NOCA
MSFMGKVGFAVAGLGLAAGSVLGAGPADAAGDQWAAYGFSDLQHGTWAAVNADSEEAAIAWVLEQCGGGPDCTILNSWANGCGAIVHSNEGWITAASGRDRGEAVRNAVDKLAKDAPMAQLANFGSSDLSGTTVVDVMCTQNAS